MISPPSLTLPRVSLSWNSITSAGAASLGIALRQNKSLKSLCLDNNSASKLGTLALLDALEANTTLRELSLASNAIENESGAISYQLAYLFARNTTLHRLKYETPPT